MSPWLDIAANFAPLWLAGGIALAAYGLFLARSSRWPILGFGLLAAVTAGVLILPEVLRPIPAATALPRMIRVIQFNVWDENRDIVGTADWIAEQHPDIVVIEEAETPIRIALAARGFVITPGFGHVAIFSRALSLKRPARLARNEWVKMPPFARATFTGPGGEYTIVGAHIPQPVYAIAASEKRMLATMLERYPPERLILTGDFNMTPWSFGLRRLDYSLGLVRLDRAVWSWPGRLSLGPLRARAVPILPIDHVYAGSAWRLVRLRRGPSLGSDHFPLVIDLADAG